MTFNAKAARAKRPCPIWVDAFQRDTQHLEADEIGAYFLILMAMWTRESCDFPDDDSRLARVSRVSTRLWKSRIGPIIRGFLTAKDGVVLSKRLREEAAYVERQVKQQSDRKTGEKSSNPLADIESDSSTDISTDEPGNHPSQQPNNPTVKDGGGGSACARAGDPKPEDLSVRERVLIAMGVGPDGVVGPSKFIGTPADLAEANRWLAMPGMSIEAVEAEIASIMRGKTDGPPSRFSYFTNAMTRLSAALSAPPLRAAEILPLHQNQARPTGHGIRAQIPEKYRQ